MASKDNKDSRIPPPPDTKQGGPLDGSRLDNPPQAPPSMSDKSADPSLWQSPVGAPPTGGLRDIVLEHAMLTEHMLKSLGQMLPSFAPIAAQMTDALRSGVTQALAHAEASPQTSLAAGSAPPSPAPPPLSGAGGAAPAGLPAPPGQAPQAGPPAQ
jgi:hypothetical protein